MRKPGTTNKAERSKKTAAQKAAAKPGQTFWHTNNSVLSREKNKISQDTVQEQLENAPAPNDTRKSGYPHRFKNIRQGEKKERLFDTGSNSSTTSYREYPVMSDGSNYDFDERPKPNPGPFRAITNQNKTFKGVIAHDGKDGRTNAGNFHRAAQDPIFDQEEEASPDERYHGKGKGKEGRRDRWRRDR
ncbi:Guanine-specific ribonuclease N1/T1 [Penicillium brevicompactum]|uniref:Guanine-specific ribonuclease N1/T1 n=1 Tax=Penicillium brevicompactum TaxID=5074 RepID=A0A9W9R4L3_PENBR|nr:Guanine-specific ribonuclease N1/T1 [Penicillium brevicompactum]